MKSLAALCVLCVFGASAEVLSPSPSPSPASGSATTPSSPPACWRDVACTGPTAAAFPGPWDAHIYAPATRRPQPRRILSLAATGAPAVDGPSYADGMPAVLTGNGSALVFDFGIEVGGVVHVRYRDDNVNNGTRTEATTHRLGLAFTEARDYIGYVSDSSNGNYRGPHGTLLSPDGALRSPPLAAGAGTYAVPVERLRGGFRYLTLYLVVDDDAGAGAGAADPAPPPTLTLDDVRVEIVFQPSWPALRAYQGYFHCADDLLNRVWYAGAYTLQTNAVPSNTGRVTTSTIRDGGWLNNATVGWVGGGRSSSSTPPPPQSVLLDGAKRDRWVWPGDMGVAVPTALYSTGDGASARAALATLYHYQEARTGRLPGTGPPALAHGGSDTYHMWAMVATYEYVLATGDEAFLRQHWAGYRQAMAYILGLVEDGDGKGDGNGDGLLSVRGLGDWARAVNVRNGSAPNMLLYHTLVTGAKLAGFVPADLASDDPAQNLTAVWLDRAARLRTAIRAAFWDPAAGAFFDGWMNRTLYPQDTNSFALAFGLLDGDVVDDRDDDSNDSTTNMTAHVSAQLTTNWTPIGPASPELPPARTNADLGAVLASVPHAQAGFTTPLGRFRAGYNMTGDGGRGADNNTDDHVVVVTWDTPAGSTGWLDWGSGSM
ncbi:alpha-L-rhamnosidase [Niveomyces insectorum RCEF 264]|uniref:Alpha-L-rhamnosidase n=1 Tax=Niveomyces insectorum RCEF 264 TaxID=1081102 RepID=A0A167TBQ3_9HYPO|nr:alpha-L-rhamnosidase [Niveomyces insectorum RCEF 264]